MPQKHKISTDINSKIANNENPGNSQANSRKANKQNRQNSMQQTQSDGNIIKSHGCSNFTQKIVSKVKSWNSKDGKGMQESYDLSNTKQVESHHNIVDTELAADFEGINLSPTDSDEGLIEPDLLKAKDSLESILSPKKEETDCGDIANSKSAPSTSQDKVLPEYPHNDSYIANTKANSSDSIAKVLAWDPWDKLSRKNKKENKRRKSDKSPRRSRENSRGRSPVSKNKDHKGYEEPVVTKESTEETEESYEYKPYKTKKKKSVEFINQVLVVHYANDEILAETTEPLKKGIEQQIRNKEMRKGHIPATMIDKRKYSDEYLTSWFKM